MDDLGAARHTRGLACAQVLLLAVALLVVVVTRGLDTWSVGSLLVIAAFSMAGEYSATHTEVRDTSVSSWLVGLILTATLYGPGPAVILAVLAIAAGRLGSKEPPSRFLFNLVSYCWAALAAALMFHGARHLFGTDSDQPLFYLLVLAAFVTGLTMNLVSFLIDARVRFGARPTTLLREMVAPVLSAELFSSVLTVLAVWIVLRLHIAGLIMFGVVVGIFQHLVGELLTSRRRSTQLRRMATTDELTGLGNRESFRQAVQERTERSPGFPVMLMDLDRFKEVNDTLGHDYGDRLLRDLGPRLQRAIGEGGIVARLGGDEFGLLAPSDADDLASLEATVASVMAAVARPVWLEELSLEIGASIGVARFPADGLDAQALLRCADIAMYAAKEAQTDYRLYEAEQNVHSVQRLGVLSDIRQALTSDQIVVHYQPIVELETRRVTGAEALVRWEHPEHGLIPPGGFVGTVEQSGLIGPLTRHVLEHAIAECARWRRAGREMSVAVNLSVRNLLDRELPREISRMLDAAHVPADALQLEITESMIMSDPERALAIVGRLSDLGVRLSVDDFGTGYSSLANLRRLPIDELKIDRSFVSPMLHDESDLIIVRSTINLGHDLGLRVIGEGVEDSATLEQLATLGCDAAQGFHLSRPLAACAFGDWLADRAPARRMTPGGGSAAPRMGSGSGRMVVAAPEA